MSANAPRCSTPATLVLFCRRPAPGVGKQRLATDLGTALTAKLAEKLLNAALEDAEAWDGPVVLAPAQLADAEWAGDLLNRDAMVVAQPDGNLGERLNAVDGIARGAGHTHIMYIGSDSPTMRNADFASARDALGLHDVVLLPAADGGVTLMGARVPWPPLANLRWSTEHLAADLERLCTNHGLTVVTLQPGYDIDRMDDLPRLLRDLATDARPARKSLHRWLKEHYG